MMKNALFILLVGLITQVCLAQEDGSQWFIPEGVVYSSGDDQRIDDIRKKLEQNLVNSKKGFYKLAKKQSGYFFMGPLLSARLRDLNPEEVNQLRSVGYNVKLAEGFEPQFDGLLAKTNKEKKLLSKLLSERIGQSKNVSLRRLHSDEMAFMWYFISWEIKEPVFVLETDEHKFILDIGALNEDQLWIEELTNPCYRLNFEEVTSDCLCFEVMLQGKKWSGGFVEKPKACEIKDEITVSKP